MALKRLGLSNVNNVVHRMQQSVVDLASEQPEIQIGSRMSYQCVFNKFDIPIRLLVHLSMYSYTNLFNLDSTKHIIYGENAKR